MLKLENKTHEDPYLLISCGTTHVNMYYYYGDDTNDDDGDVDDDNDNICAHLFFNIKR